MATRRESAESASAPARERLGIAWSDQSVRLLVLAVAVAVILWLARGIIGPFIVAAVLAYAFSPVVSGVQSRTRLPRAAVIGIGYVLFLGIAGVLAFVAAERAGKELHRPVLGRARHLQRGAAQAAWQHGRHRRQLVLGGRPGGSDQAGLPGPDQLALERGAGRRECGEHRASGRPVPDRHVLLPSRRAPIRAVRVAVPRSRAASRRTPDRPASPRRPGAMAAGSAVVDRPGGSGLLRDPGPAPARSLCPGPGHVERRPGDHSARRPDNRSGPGGDRHLRQARHGHDDRGPGRLPRRPPGRGSGGHAARDRSGGPSPPGRHHLRRPRRAGHLGHPRWVAGGSGRGRPQRHTARALPRGHQGEGRWSRRRRRRGFSRRPGRWRRGRRPQMPMQIR